MAVAQELIDAVSVVVEGEYTGQEGQTFAGTATFTLTLTQPPAEVPPPEIPVTPLVEPEFLNITAVTLYKDNSAEYKPVETDSVIHIKINRTAKTILSVDISGIVKDAFVRSITYASPMGVGTVKSFGALPSDYEAVTAYQAPTTTLIVYKVKVDWYWSELETTPEIDRIYGTSEVNFNITRDAAKENQTFQDALAAGGFAKKARGE